MKKATVIVYLIIAAYIIVFLFGVQLAKANNSTLRYGAPADIRCAEIR